MAAGVRSLLAFWAGGAGASPAATQAGVKSPLAFWLGGAGVPTAATQASVRGLLAFWMGGASAADAEPEEDQSGGGGGTYPLPRYTPPQRARKRLDDAKLQPAADRLPESVSETPDTAPNRNVKPGVPATRFEGQRFAASELAAVVRQVSPTGALPPLVRLPTRTISPATANDDDMALLMFALFMAMDDD